MRATCGRRAQTKLILHAMVYGKFYSAPFGPLSKWYGTCTFFFDKTNHARTRCPPASTKPRSVDHQSNINYPASQIRPAGTHKRWSLPTRHGTLGPCLGRVIHPFSAAVFLIAQRLIGHQRPRAETRRAVGRRCLLPCPPFFGGTCGAVDVWSLSLCAASTVVLRACDSADGHGNPTTASRARRPVPL